MLVLQVRALTPAWPFAAVKGLHMPPVAGSAVEFAGLRSLGTCHLAAEVRYSPLHDKCLVSLIKEEIQLSR